MQAVEGQQHLGEIGGDGRRELLTGGTLPSSWHLLIFLCKPSFPGTVLPSWVGSIPGVWGTCCCHRALGRGAKGEVTARCLKAPGANSPSPASCLLLSAHSRCWSNSTKPSSCSKYTFPTSPASFLPPPQQFCWAQTLCRRSPAQGRDGPSARVSQGMAEGAQHSPVHPHSSTASTSDGKSWLHAIPSDPRASPDISTYSLLCWFPGPACSLHSTGWGGGVQNHKPEPPTAPPQPGPCPSLEGFLGVLSFPKHQFHACTHIPAPWRCQTWLRPP